MSLLRVPQRVLQLLVASSYLLLQHLSLVGPSKRLRAQPYLRCQLLAKPQPLTKAMEMQRGSLRASTSVAVIRHRGRVLLPLALIILGLCRGTVAALLCNLFSFLYSSIDGYGSKNQHVEETWIQRKKV